MNGKAETYGRQTPALGRFRPLYATVRPFCISVLSVSALSLSSPAFAQSATSPDAAENVPVANPQRGNVSQSTKKGSVDVKPETLNTPSLNTINPRHISKRGVRSNRWDTQTLTRSVRLSAIQPRSGGTPVSIKNVPGLAQLGEVYRPVDVLSAQDLLSAGTDQTSGFGVSIEKTPQTDAVTNLSSTLRGALFDLPSLDSVDRSVFKLDLAGQLCLGTTEECKKNDIQRIELGFAKNLTTGKPGGLNLQLTPRGHLQVNDDGKSALVGALVRIGDDLRKGSEMNSNTWYFFAGADAEALTFTPNSVRRLTSGDFHLQDRIIVGDAQAGVGYRLGDADLALTYMRRQTSAENYSYDSDAAALSVTWRR